MRSDIPAPVISVLSDGLSNLESHSSIDSLFMYADAPGDPPEGSRQVKVLNWLRRINKESDNPLVVLGKLIEGYMEQPEPTAEANDISLFGSTLHIPNPKIELKNQISAVLSQYNLAYITGGYISDGRAAPSRSLAELIKGRDIHAIDIEFTRALDNVISEPREAVSAACNILEAIFKVYIADEGLSMPKKQDLQSVWKVVRADLGFDTNRVEDDDLKKILSGILSVVDGMGAFRTHASSAHALGRKIYKLKPRHARLAVNSAHSMAMFILETWDEKKRG